MQVQAGDHPPVPSPVPLSLLAEAARHFENQGQAMTSKQRRGLHVHLHSGQDQGSGRWEQPRAPCGLSTGASKHLRHALRGWKEQRGHFCCEEGLSLKRKSCLETYSVQTEMQECPALSPGEQPAYGPGLREPENRMQMEHSWRTSGLGRGRLRDGDAGGCWQGPRFPPRYENNSPVATLPEESLAELPTARSREWRALQ